MHRIAALARNEAAWIGLAWLLVAAGDTRRRGPAWVIRVVGSAGAVALLVFGPWLIRDWLTYGTPLPGQAISNAFSLAGYDIFAWQDPPTLTRYLAAGAATLVSQRVDALDHNLVSVLLVPGFPISLIGMVTLPWVGRNRSLRPILAASLLIFLITTLFFPVATTWGTFLHAAVPALVLLLVAGLLALDAGLAWLGRRLGWERPIAWLGPLFGAVSALAFTALAVPAYGTGAGNVLASYSGLGQRLVEAGAPLAKDVPVIVSHPMWYAEATGSLAIGLPDESVASILDLARHFGARLVVIDGDYAGWTARLTSDPDRACLARVGLAPVDADPFAVYEISCP